MTQQEFNDLLAKTEADDALVGPTVAQANTDAGVAAASKNLANVAIGQRNADVQALHDDIEATFPAIPSLP